MILLLCYDFSIMSSRYVFLYRLLSTCVYADRRKFNESINSLVTDQLVLEGDTDFVFNIWLAHIVW